MATYSHIVENRTKTQQKKLNAINKSLRAVVQEQYIRNKTKTNTTIGAFKKHANRMGLVKLIRLQVRGTSLTPEERKYVNARIHRLQHVY